MSCSKSKHSIFYRIRRKIGRLLIGYKNDVSIELSDSEGIFTKANDIPLIFPATDKCQLSAILSTGNYQFAEFSNVISYLRSNNLLKEGIFIDVGANVGTHTLYALKEPEFKHVIAAEPSRSNLYFLEHNLLLNKADNLVTIIPCAIGDKNKKSRLVKNPINCGDYRLAPNAATKENLFNEDSFSYEEINTITLDELLQNAKNFDDIGLIWMDTQGSEGLILGNSVKISETKAPIYIEFWPYGMDRLNSYTILREFIFNNIKTIVRFIDGKICYYSPNDIDNIYNEFQGTGNFCDLLLLR